MLFEHRCPRSQDMEAMNAALREIFSREADEPIPDISILPPDVLELHLHPAPTLTRFQFTSLSTASLATMAQHNPARLGHEALSFRIS